MPKCKDCKYYRQRTDSEKGDCLGYEVMPETDAENCPTQSFVPKESGAK
ncbi:MAG: hypothetical protein WCT37_02205 [Patescibacteria group bacterium]